MVICSDVQGRGREAAVGGGGGRAFYPLPRRDAGANTVPAKGGNPKQITQALLGHADRLRHHHSSTLVD